MCAFDFTFQKKAGNVRCSLFYLFLLLLNMWPSTFLFFFKEDPSYFISVVFLFLSFFLSLISRFIFTTFN